MASRWKAAQLEVHVTDSDSSALGSRLAALGSRRYDENIRRTTHAVLESKGVTEPKLRWAVFHRRTEEIPHALRTYVGKVSQHAYQVTDADVEGLKKAGYSEDAIFELTCAAALGAAVLRLERGLIALHVSGA